MANLFSDIPTTLPDELVEQLAASGGTRIERIVSRGQHSPPGFWYDQAQAEFVVLLSGSATLEFADRSTPLQLGAGDWLLIAAHRRHRVVATDADRDSIWLAVHLPPEDAACAEQHQPQASARMA